MLHEELRPLLLKLRELVLAQIALYFFGAKLTFPSQLDYANKNERINHFLLLEYI